MWYTNIVLNHHTGMYSQSVVLLSQYSILMTTYFSAKVTTEETRKPRRHIRQTAWQKRLKSFEKWDKNNLKFYLDLISRFQGEEIKLYSYLQVQPEYAKEGSPDVQGSVDVLVHLDPRLPEHMRPGNWTPQPAPLAGRLPRVHKPLLCLPLYHRNAAQDVCFGIFRLHGVTLQQV